MIGIIGISGKVGSFIAESLSNEYNIVGYDNVVTTRFMTYNNLEFFDNDFEFIIDFSNSELSKNILIECIDRKIKVISGTSNIPNLNEICKLSLDNKVSFIYLENFSVGINQLVSFLHKIDCDKKEITEEHFYMKSDISQTAISLAKLLGVKSEEINIIRTQRKQSNHYLKFYFENEEIEVIHRCFNPKAYIDVLMFYINEIKNSDFYHKCGIIDSAM